ncbi:MAG: TonB-dependent receptor [Prevotella sp.]|nr:TonB-dependent receptor [Prevotella sp.]
MALNADEYRLDDMKPSDAGELDVDSLIELDGMEIVASRAPIPADKAVRLVQVINREDIEASSAQSVNDLLKQAAGVDVRQRGGFGIQTDIGVNGGSSDQLTVMLNGINITNPQTGHLTVDLPVNVDDIERIEILEGGASRVYGSCAFSGVINIVTRNEKTNHFGANVTAGSYGTFGGNASVNLKSENFTNRVSGGYSKSDGNCNNDFEKINAFYNGAFNSDLWEAKLQLGTSRMDYGANTFYGTGSNTQYEENRRYLASVQAEYKGRIHVLPQVYWNRSLDHYVWQRANPEAYQNFHQTNVYGASINSYTTWSLGKTAIGFDWRKEDILSTRLGKEITDKDLPSVPGHSDQHYKYEDDRSNYGIFLEHDILLRNFTFSLGVLANKNTSVEGGMKLYPGVDISWRPIENIKIYGSFNQSLRTPTYTDLYYNGPGLTGNSSLYPEKSTDYSLGANYANSLLNFQVKGFYRIGTDMIDWVKKEGAKVYTTANSDIDDIGIESILAFKFRDYYGARSWIQTLTFSYCYNYKYRVDEEQTSTYVSQLTFLRHKFVTSLNHRIAGKAYAQWDFQIKNRNGEFDNALTGERQKYGSFANLDLKLYWQDKNYDLYLTFNNLTNHKYYDIANVQQPGLWFMGGVKVKINW